MFCDDILGVIVDVGHKKSAIGYIGDDCPRYSTASMSGVRTDQGMDVEVENGKVAVSNLVFGENLTCRHSGVRYQPLLEREAVKDHVHYGQFLQYLLSRMRVEPRETALLLSDQNSNLHDKDTISQMVFEQLQMPAFFTIKKSVLSLFANGRTTGLVLESGATLTQVVPVNEGYTLGKASLTSPVGGETMTQNIINFIEEKRGKPLLPHFCYKYNIDAEGAKEGSLKDISNIDPSVLQFHKMRYCQEMKEMLFKVSTPSEEKYQHIT
jgi:actin-related protein